MTQILDGDDLAYLAKMAKAEGWSRTKFATQMGIHYLTAKYVWPSD